MNLQKGFKRLTLILSFLISLFVAVVISYDDYDNEVEALVGFAVTFMSVWLVYFLIRFVVRGFLDKAKEENR